MQDKVFPSKRDSWIGAMIWFGIVMMVYAAYEIMRYQQVMALVSLLSAFFMGWVYYGTGYCVTRDKVIIRCGPFKWTVSIDEIAEIYPTRNPLSSPACSLDRLRINYRDKKAVMVSPEDKKGFLRAVVARNDNLVLEGDRVHRKEKL